MVDLKDKEIAEIFEATTARDLQAHLDARGYTIEVIDFEAEAYKAKTIAKKMAIVLNSLQNSRIFYEDSMDIDSHATADVGTVLTEYYRLYPEENTHAEILDKLLALMADNLYLTVDELRGATDSTVDSLGADSLDITTLEMEIEALFEVKIGIAVSSTIKSIARQIQQKLNETFAAALRKA